MIEAQMKEYASLASQHGIEDIIVAEMQRVNGDQEVRPLFPLLPLPQSFSWDLCI